MSDSIDRVFVHALNTVKRIPRMGSARPPSADRLKLYGLYKQSTEGDVDGVMERPRGESQEMKSDQEKWDAWNYQKGVSKTEAKRQYISTLIETMHRYASATPDARELVSELEFVWDQIKSNPPSSSSGSQSYPLHHRNSSDGNSPPLHRTDDESPPVYPVMSAQGSRNPRPPTRIDRTGRALRVLSPVSQSQADAGAEADADQENTDAEEEAEEFVDAPDSQLAENDGRWNGSQPSAEAGAGEKEGRTKSIMAPLSKYLTQAAAAPKDDKDTSKLPQDDGTGKWHRRIESALIKMNAEMSALREQLDMQNQNYAMYASILHPFKAKRSGGRGGVVRWALSFVWRVSVTAARHVVIDATLLALVTLWCHFRGIPAERVEKHILEFVHKIQQMAVLKKLEKLRDWKGYVRLPMVLPRSITRRAG